MTTNEILSVEAMLYDVLSDSPSGFPVFSGFAPADAEPPFYLFSYQDSDDVRGVGVEAARVMTRFRYTVRGCMAGSSYAAVQHMADWLDSQLHAAADTSDDGRRLRVIRLYPFAQREPNEGDWYVSLGGVYQVWIDGLDPESIAMQDANFDPSRA